MGSLIHTRYAAWSSNFEEFIKELGYVLDETVHGKDKKKVYKTKTFPTKYIEVTWDHIRLYKIINGKEVESYKGFTVHDEIVTFFTQRNPQDVKTDL